MKQRNIVITGASRGLGRALAIQSASHGHRIVLVARNADALHHVSRLIASQGGQAHPVVADVGEPASALRIAHQAAALVGEVDLLVHNASWLGPTPLREMLDTESETLEKVLQTNLIGPFRLTRALAGSMILRGGGDVVLVSSDAAVEAYPTWGAYGVSKAALDHMGRVLAAELADRGVRVISIDPGEMDTDMHAAAIPGADRSALAPPELVARQILAIVHSSQRVESGSRIVASQWQAVAS